ncbi:sugar O-acetyltransferase [Aliikangiella coralliicola]|uniref:Nodulation protein L n=2 Tax=Aliikangiella coralliicola TaxID=2592383 RepID=A0A545U0M1_9GAMM|nr:sugar O-acetyltransferase [Aliikangiella coralliicola]
MEQFDSRLPELREQRNRVHDICRQFNRSPSKGNLKKLKTIFSRCGDEVFIEQGFYCDYGDRIRLGDRVYINVDCTLLDGGKIAIGDDCLIGPKVQILTINHALSPKERLKKENFCQDVIIGKNVWIGASAIILPGVTIGDGAVIGAASVVTRDLDSNCLYLGNPARMERRLDD